MYSAMKRALRPFYSILLLIMVAATLTVRVMLHYGSIQLKYDTAIVKTSERPAFNATLLNYASVDLGEAPLKQQIEELLEGNFRRRGRQRSFLSSRKYNIDVRMRPGRGISAQLRSPEFYRLWLTFRRYLSDWSRNRMYQPDAMLNLVSGVKVPIDQYNGNKEVGKKYKSCAVVGNSGILLQSEYGQLIDSHEAVLRLNNARTGKNFDQNVGSKTSVSFVNSNILHLCARREGCFCHPYGTNVPIIMYVCQPAHFLDYLVCNSSHKSPLIITNPQFDTLCARIVKYYSLKRFIEKTGKDVGEWGAAHEGANFHYSSGMQAIMLALGICDKVSVFGFGKSTLAKHHYHTNQKVELSLHDYEAEYDFYHDLVKRPQIVDGSPGESKTPK